MADEGTRTLLVEGDKTFMIDIPVDSKVTFGPFSPPRSNSKGGGGFSYDDRRGTLRIYKGTKDNVIAVFAGVDSFRDITNVNYREQVAKEEGATIWKSDQNGYERSESVARQTDWVDPVAELEAPKPARRSRKKSS